MKSTNHILNTFLKYTTLNVLGMVGLSCYILADTFFVARGLGPSGLTALNLAIPVYSFIHGLGLMVGMGGATKYSILKSSSEANSTHRIFTQSVLFALALSSVFLFLGLFFSGPLSTLLGANEAVHPMTSTYLQVILVFAPMFMLNNVLICFVRNDGNPKLSMLAMLLGSFSNIVLDYVFVFPCQLGMFGAAIATGLAPVISMMILSLHFIRKRNHFQPVKTGLGLKSMGELSSLGASSLIIEVSSGIVMITFNSIILALEGNMGVAAYGIIANLALVVLAIFTGISQGIQPIISGYYGSGKYPEMKKIYRYAITTALLFALAIYGITFLFAAPIVELFNKEGDVALMEIAVNGMHIYFIGFLFVGVNAITAGYFSSSAKAGEAFCIAVLRGFLLILPLALLLSALMGLNGVWLAFPATEFLTLLVCIAFMYKAKYTLPGR